MTRKEVHDIANMLAPALSLSQNLLLGFHGDLPEKQRKVIKKIEKSLKELQMYLHQQAASERSDK